MGKINGSIEESENQSSFAILGKSCPVVQLEASGRFLTTLSSGALHGMDAQISGRSDVSLKLKSKEEYLAVLLLCQSAIPAKSPSVETQERFFSKAVFRRPNLRGFRVYRGCVGGCFRKLSLIKLEVPFESLVISVISPIGLNQ